MSEVDSYLTSTDGLYTIHIRLPDIYLFVYLSDAPRRRLVVTGDSAMIQDKLTESSAWFFNVLGVYHRHTGPRFNVSSGRLLVILVGQSYALPTELYRLVSGQLHDCLRF